MRSRIFLVVLAGAAGLSADACSHASLIRRDDPVLDDSQRRLATTAAAVDALHPPPPERLLFMQAVVEFNDRAEANFEARHPAAP